MIRINLLPVRQIRQRIQTRNEVIAFVLGLIILICAIAFVGISQINKIKSLNSEVVSLKEEKAKYAKIIRQIEQIIAEQKVLETKLKVINDLKVYSQFPVRLVDEIANITPSNRLWLNAVSLTDKGINLTGVALDNATVARYMELIKASPYFTDAELSNASQTTVAGQKLKSFSLRVGLNSPIKEAPPQKQGKGKKK